LKITKKIQDDSVPLQPDFRAVRFKNMKHELKRFLEMTDAKLEKERKRWVLCHWVCSIAMITSLACFYFSFYTQDAKQAIVFVFGFVCTMSGLIVSAQTRRHIVLVQELKKLKSNKTDFPDSAQASPEI
jgi:hypothetical protein